MQYTNKNLCLPLIRDSFLSSTAQKQLHGLGYIPLVSKLVIKIVAANAVIGAGQHDDDTVFPDGSFCRSHALHRLIHILIQRVSAVCGDHNIRRLGLRAAESGKKIGAFFMGRFQIACHRIDHLLITVQHNIDNILQIDFPGCPQHIRMDGVALQDAGAGLGMGYKLRTMVGEHRFPGRDTGQHALSAAGETGEEMGFYEAFCKQQVGLHRQPVDTARAAGGKGSDIHKFFPVIAVVNHDFLIFHDLLTKF